MDFSEWEVGEWACYDDGVNCGVGGMMLGFETTMRFTGKSCRCSSILSPYRIVSRLPFCGRFDPRIGDTSDVCCGSLAKVVDSCPADSTSISTVVLHRLDRKVSDRVAKVEAMCEDESCD